jgi:hypothetical protein
VKTRLALALACLLALPGSGRAAGAYTVRDAASLGDLAVPRVEPGLALVFDNRATEEGKGLISFEDWARDFPLQKQFLSLHPGYQEPNVTETRGGVTRTTTEKLSMYVATARFVLDRAPGDIDLARYASLDFLERMDPAIKHRRMEAAEALPNKDPDAPYNRHPGRRWCEGPCALCISSVYKLEGKLPMGVRLANKLEEGEKRHAETVEFQSELRVVPRPEIDGAGLARLTGVEGPVTGVLEQSIFHVKLMAVLQPHPSQPGKTVATLFMALSVKTRVLDRQREFGSVPVLRNMVPVQVLLGRSSFNAGESISAGLPAYARNRVKAIAGILAKE